MTAHTHSTLCQSDCTVVDINGCRYISGTFTAQTTIPSSPNELDQIVDLADQIGRHVQQKVAITSIEHADGQIAALACQVHPLMRKHGHRPFSVLTQFGRNEEARLEAKQQHFMDTVLAEHGDTLKLHGFLPPPSAEASVPENVEEPETDATIATEAMAMYQYFTSQVSDKQEPNESTVAPSSHESSNTIGNKKLEVISDGAAWIGIWIAGFCGVEVYHILCWYHLSKRVCVGLSGLGFSKTERLKYQKEILGHLWHGRVSEAIKILKELVPRSRVPERVEELIDYLVRKRYMIGDYAQRHALGLWIASTRVEKWNDTAVSERCKHRGMSWTLNGVMAMALAACENKRKNTQTTQINTATHTSP